MAWSGVVVWAAVGLLLGPATASLTVRVPVGARATMRPDTLVGGGATRARIIGIALALAAVLASVGASGPLVRSVVPLVAVAGVALVVVDVEHHRLPDLLVVPTLVVFVLANVAAAPRHILPMLLTGAAFFVVFFLLAMVSPSGLGFGDVKLAALVGAVLGRLDPTLSILWVLATGIAAGLWFGYLLVRRLATWRTAVPFGPPMLVALWAVVAAVAAHPA